MYQNNNLRNFSLHKSLNEKTLKVNMFSLLSSKIESTSDWIPGKSNELLQKYSNYCLDVPNILHLVKKKIWIPKIS